MSLFRSKFISQSYAFATAALIALPPSLAAQDFWDEWPPDEGDCGFCPPILAGTLGGEIEWGVEHVGFSIDEQLWDDLVELAKELIDKIPGGETTPGEEPPGEEPPEEEPPGDDPDDEDDGEKSTADGSGYKGRIVTLVEAVGVPQVMKRNRRYFVEYQLPKGAIEVAKDLVVERAVRLSVSPDAKAAVVVPKGSYPVSADGRLRFPIELRKPK